MRKTGMAMNVLASVSLVALASCGGSASEGDIQGTVSGLGTGLSVTLQDNGADNLATLDEPGTAPSASTRACRPAAPTT